MVSKTAYLHLKTINFINKWTCWIVNYRLTINPILLTLKIAIFNLKISFCFDFKSRKALLECVLALLLTGRFAQFYVKEDKVEEFIKMYPDVDGIFVSGASMSSILYKRLLEKGKKIPEDIQLISYDGFFGDYGYGNEITCVEQPIEQIAKKCIKILLLWWWRGIWLNMN